MKTLDQKKMKEVNGGFLVCILGSLFVVTTIAASSK